MSVVNCWKLFCIKDSGNYIGSYLRYFQIQIVVFNFWILLSTISWVFFWGIISNLPEIFLVSFIGIIATIFLKRNKAMELMLSQDGIISETAEETSYKLERIVYVFYNERKSRGSNYNYLIGFLQKSIYETEDNSDILVLNRLIRASTTTSNFKTLAEGRTRTLNNEIREAENLPMNSKNYNLSEQMETQSFEEPLKFQLEEEEIIQQYILKLYTKSIKM